MKRSRSNMRYRITVTYLTRKNTLYASDLSWRAATRLRDLAKSLGWRGVEIRDDIEACEREAYGADAGCWTYS